MKLKKYLSALRLFPNHNLMQSHIKELNLKFIYFLKWWKPDQLL